jgi:hypothetical protein
MLTTSIVIMVVSGIIAAVAIALLIWFARASWQNEATTTTVSNCEANQVYRSALLSDWLFVP